MKDALSPTEQSGRWDQLEDMSPEDIAAAMSLSLIHISEPTRPY